MMNPIIEVKNLSLAYHHGRINEVKALDTVNLKIYPGEFVAFFGPSGCGKSSLLYVLGGLEKPTDGQVLVNQQELSSLSSKKLSVYRRTSIGFVFQSFNLITSLNVLQNVVLPWIWHGKSKGERESKAEFLLERFGLKNIARRPVSDLSGGQQQRVGVARALINDTPIILADEPTGNLDSRNAKQIMELLAGLNEQDNKTIILVTHDAPNLRFASRIFYMEDGRIIKEIINPEQKKLTPEFLTEQPVASGFGVLARLYPHLSERELQVKALSNHLFSTCHPYELERVERALSTLLSQEIDFAEFQEELDRSFGKGGVGLYAQTAQELTTKVTDILALSQKVDQFVTQSSLESGEPESEDSERRMIEEIKEYLLKVCHGELSLEQIMKLREAIRDRLQKRHLPDAGQIFQTYLDKPLKKGGLGLNERTARRVSQFLEIILIPYGAKK